MILRPAQQSILDYQGGQMGITAVPGSGKTWTLSLLAAQIVASGALADDQEVLVVTLVNSAVDNFYQRVSAFIHDAGLLPHIGYRVRTLHGLAHDIVRERPGLLNLADNFQIVDERETDSILKEAGAAWLRSHPYDLDDHLDPDLDESRRDWLRRGQLLELVVAVASSLIRAAKDLRLSPERLRQRLEELPIPLSLAEMGCQVYEDYQRALAYRGGVDFDDLISLALQALESDTHYLDRLRQRWPFILEDEAQDSSRLQEQILSLLAGPQGNWVRVGDPNQAIYETFTTADPRFLIEFMQRPGVQTTPLPNSGRSTQSIIDLANQLVRWTQAEHPQEAARSALHSPPLIEPAPPGDPQPNPLDDPSQVILVEQKFTPQEEIEYVVASLAAWLPDHAQDTVAVLAPRNQRAFELADALRQRGLPCEDSLLRSSSSTRLSAGVLGNLLRYLADPGSPRKLATAYRVWRREDRQEQSAQPGLERATGLLRKLDCVEDYLWPTPGRDWLARLRAAEDSDADLDSLVEFRRLVQRWQAAILLPVDQLVLALAQDLFRQPGELALAHKLAVLLGQASQTHPTWRLPELSDELGVIARNERRFLGFSDDDLGFDPDSHKGEVVVATIHKAKGLEWKRVYLMSVNNYDFPSGQAFDRYIPEKWFIRDRLNLEAEALAQLHSALGDDEYAWYQEGEATLQARLDYVRERLRLLYVGITRAQEELVITWNTGRDGKQLPAVPLIALQEFWRSAHPEE